MLYGIAVDIAPTEVEAEEILIETFKNFHQKNLIAQNYPSHCITLIKLIIQTAHEQLNPKQSTINFKLKQFENAPMLHKILCEQVDIDNHCVENSMTRADIGKLIKEELNLLLKRDISDLKTTERFEYANK